MLNEWQQNSDIGVGNDTITADHNLTNQRQNVSQNVLENFDSDPKKLEVLTFPAPFISESCVKIKINLNCYFHFSLWCLKRLYEGLSGLQKTFWGTTKKCENKNLSFFSPCPGSGREGLRVENDSNSIVAYLNINSLGEKINHLREIYKESPVNILCVDETKLHSSYPDAQFHIIPLFRRVRNKYGGGKILFIRQGLITRRLLKFETKVSETVCVELTISKKK